jgi:hypothetical protein
MVRRASLTLAADRSRIGDDVDALRKELSTAAADLARQRARKWQQTTYCVMEFSGDKISHLTKMWK